MDQERLEGVLATLEAGEDFGISHKGGCREALAAKQEGRDTFQGPGRCKACGNKSDLRLPGAEKIVVGMGCKLSEPEVAKDLMEAAQGIEYTWIAFRVHVIDCESGEILGHGVGSRALSESHGSTNTMFKMGKKSAIIDAVKTTFALSGRFTQDTPLEEASDPTPPAAPPAAPPTPTPAQGHRGRAPYQFGNAPAPPAPPSGGLEVGRKSGGDNRQAEDHPIPFMLLDKHWEFYGGIPFEQRKALFEAAGWRDGEPVTDEHKRTVLGYLHQDIHAFVKANNFTSKMVTEWSTAERRHYIFDPWFAQFTSKTAQ